MSKRIFSVVFIFIILLTACTTTSDINNLSVSLEQSGIKSPTSFYILKGNDSEYINNINFKKYSAHLSESLQEDGWKPASYSDADVFLFLEYGIDAFYRSKRKIKPQYDEKTGVTSWVHKDSRIEKMVFIRVSAADCT